MPIEEKGRYRTTHILYAGSSTTKPEVDVATGTLDAYWTPLAAILTTGIGDRVRVLVITGRARVDIVGSNTIAYGDDPLVGYHYTLNYILVNAKMDKRRQEELNTRFNAIIKSEWGNEHFSKLGSSSLTGSIEENTKTWIEKRNSLESFKKKHTNLL